MEVDRAQQLANAMEKKARNFDKIIGEWKMKVGTSHDGNSIDDSLDERCDGVFGACKSCKTVFSETLDPIGPMFILLGFLGTQYLKHPAQLLPPLTETLVALDMKDINITTAPLILPGLFF